jgi:hypothetical protein
MTRDMKHECYECKHRQEIIGDCHSRCSKPDPDMTGNEHGIKHGWFCYPWNFDPIWKTKLCDNFEPAVSDAVSGAVSDENETTRPS